MSTPDWERATGVRRPPHEYSNPPYHYERPTGTYGPYVTAACAATERQAAALRTELAAMTDLRDRAIARQDQLRQQLADTRARSARKADQLIDARAALAIAVGCPQHGHDCEPDDHIDPHAHQ